MADIIDQASKTQHRMEQAAIDSARRNATRRDAEPVGYCLDCGDDLGGERRWCDASCRDRWEHRRS